MDLSNVISANQVRIVNFDLAVFDRVFLPDPGLESTFAQNKSCRSSLPLQLLFWPNFKSLYQILRFGWSNASQKWSKSNIVLPCAPLFSAPIPRPTAGDSTRRPSVILAHRADASLSARDAHHLFILIPFSFLALVRSQAEQSSPSTSLRPNLAVLPRFLAPRAP